MPRVWRNEDNLRVSLHVTLSEPNATHNVPNPNLNQVSEMIQVLVSILALIAAVSVAYLLTIIDSIIHHQLYQFGLRFNYDWANPYWMAFRISLALLGLIAAASSINIAYFFWRRLKKPELAKVARKVTGEEAKAEAAPQPSAGVPSLFQCTSCGRSISHPLRMLDFHSQRPKMISICPFCNATVVPVRYAYSKEKATPSEEEEEEIRKRIKKSFNV